jgi:hypothetical protein
MLLICLPSILILFAAMLFGGGNFYFQGDAQDQFYPTFYEMGRLLLSSQWPFISHRALHGGNFLIEVQSGAFNPVILLFSLLFYKLKFATVSTGLFIWFHLYLLVFGSYKLGKVFLKNPIWLSLFVGMISTQVFLISLHATDWWSGMTSFVWLIWSIRAWIFFRPLAFTIFGFLMITSGHPQAQMFYGIFIGLSCVMNPFHHSRLRWLLGITPILIAAPSFLPALFAFPYTNRFFHFQSTGILAPSFWDLLNLANPDYKPWFRFSSGDFGNIWIPALYTAWFVWIFLANVDYRNRLPKIFLFLSLGIFSIMLLPDEMLAFRFPLRMMPYLILGISLLFASSIESSMAWSKNRVYVSGIFTVVVALASQTFIAAIILAALFLFGLFLFKQKKPWQWFALVSFFLVQTGIYFHFSLPDRSDSQLAMRMLGKDSTIEDHFVSENRTLSFYQGRNVSWEENFGISERTSTRTIRGLQGLSLTNSSFVNGYTPLGHKGLDALFCFSTLGEVCLDEIGRGWNCGNTLPKCPGTMGGLFTQLTNKTNTAGVPRVFSLAPIDALKINRVVFNNVQRPKEVSLLEPFGFKKVNLNTYERELPSNSIPNSPISFVSPNLKITHLEFNNLQISFEFEKNDNHQGQIIFNRLHWPGYKYHLVDSTGVSANPELATSYKNILIQVNVPNNLNSGFLKLSYWPEGLTPSFILSVIGIFLIVPLIKLNMGYT